MKRMATEIRREQIIDKAMQIINEFGYQAFTTRRIAKEIGVSEPALYRHFKNKDEILIGIITKMDELWAMIVSTVKGLDYCREKLSVFIKMHFEFIEKNPNIVGILFADENLRWNKYVYSYLGEVQYKRYSFLLKLLEEGTEKDEFCCYDSEILGIMILGTIRAAILNWRYSPAEYSLTKKGARVEDTLLKIITNKNNVNS